MKHGLLGLLNYEDMTGYDLTQIYKRSLFFMWKAQMSQIYRELTTMEKKGWLSSSLVPQIGSPNKKVYAITPAGRDELLRWLNESEESDYALPYQYGFLVKIFFSGETDPERCLERMRKFRDSRRILLETLAGIGPDFNPTAEKVSMNKKKFWLLVKDMGQEIMSTEIEWAERCIRKLEGLDYEEN